MTRVDTGIIACSFIGGCLIGTSVSLPVLMLNVGEDDGVALLCSSLILMLAGIGMHVRGSKATAHRSRIDP